MLIPIPPDRQAEFDVVVEVRVVLRDRPGALSRSTATMRWPLNSVADASRADVNTEVGDVVYNVVHRIVTTEASDG